MELTGPSHRTPTKCFGSPGLLMRPGTPTVLLIQAILCITPVLRTQLSRREMRNYHHWRHLTTLVITFLHESVTYGITRVRSAHVWQIWDMSLQVEKKAGQQSVRHAN